MNMFRIYAIENVLNSTICSSFHTGPLEIFHSALLKYLPKRQAFSYEGMRERAYLAIMEHNENIVAREQATTTTGVFSCTLNTKITLFMMFTACSKCILC